MKLCGSGMDTPFKNPESVSAAEVIVSGKTGEVADQLHWLGLPITG